MPKEISKKIDLIWKHNPKTFEKINAEVYANPSQRLGPNHNVVERMTLNFANEMKYLLPGILATSPDSQEWYKKLNDYWFSIGYSIPPEGRTLEVGFKYDINDYQRAANILLLIAELKKRELKPIEIITVDDLANYVENSKEIIDTDKYKYASPINVQDYLLYLFATAHGDVANSIKDQDKSGRIRFIMSSQEEIKNVKRDAHILTVKAQQKYFELLGDQNIHAITNVLYALGKNVSEYNDRTDQEVGLREECDNNPTKFLEVVNDRNLLIKARIERYLFNGILKRLPDSSIIIDAQDPSITIGRDMAEAVNYFTSEEATKIAKVNEYKTLLKDKNK